MKRVLLIDDVRTKAIIALDWDIEVSHIARNYFEGIKMLKEGNWDMLCLDHDLASYDDDGNEKTGYHVICFLEANREFLPKELVCVSANPVGARRILQVWDKIKG